VTHKLRVDSAFVAVAALLLPALVLGTPPAASQTQEPYNFTASLLGGFAGSTDADPGDGVDNLALQAGFNLVTQPRTQLGFRLGRVDLGSGDRFGSLRDADLTYFTIAGEYRLRERFYDSGVFFGLGLYRLNGTPVLDVGSGNGGDESAAGLNLGVVGDFEVGRKFSFLLELSGHYVDFDEANVFVMALAGVGVHFR
jgi:hypothetical protein